VERRRGTGLVQDMYLTPRPVESAFGRSVLPLTVAALLEPRHRRVLELVTALEPRHASDTPLDRLLVILYPALRPYMVAHYENQRPPLAGLKSSEELRRIDHAMSAVVRALACVPALPDLVRRVRRDDLRAEAVLAALQISP
jgi:hypothetical protein